MLPVLALQNVQIILLMTSKKEYGLGIEQKKEIVKLLLLLLLLLLL